MIYFMLLLLHGNVSYVYCHTVTILFTYCQILANFNFLLKGHCHLFASVTLNGENDIYIDGNFDIMVQFCQQLPFWGTEISSNYF